MTWNGEDLDDVAIKFLDERGQTKTALIRVLAVTNDADIQALIATMQAVSKASVASYKRVKGFVNDAAAAATAFNSSTNPFGKLSEALLVDCTCGPDEEKTRTSIYMPAPANLIAGSRNKIVLDSAAATFTNLENALAAVATNTKGTAVDTIERTQVESRKSRRLI